MPFCPKSYCLTKAFFLPSFHFNAVAFALQAKNRLGLYNPVQCIGFARKGHEGRPDWGIGHRHDEEIQLWIDMWKTGTELVHLEWEEFREELLASVHLKTFFSKSFRMRSLQVTAHDMQITLEEGLRNVLLLLEMPKTCWKNAWRTPSRF